MRGQTDYIYDNRIPFTAVEVYVELQKLPEETELTFEQICEEFEEISSDDMKKCLEFLLNNNWLFYDEERQVYSVNGNKNIRVFRR